MFTLFQRLAENYGGTVPEIAHNLAVFGEKDNSEPFFEVAYYVENVISIYTPTHTGEDNSPEYVLEFENGKFTDNAMKLIHQIEQDSYKDFADGKRAVGVYRNKVVHFLNDFIMQEFSRQLKAK